MYSTVAIKRFVRLAENSLPFVVAYQKMLLLLYLDKLLDEQFLIFPLLFKA